VLKFNELRKLKTITGIIVFIKYSLWCYFFILQGKAIELAIERNKLQKELIYTLVGFILVKMVVMLCDIFQKFFIEYYKNMELKRQWSSHLPKAIYSDNHNKKNDINVLFFDYLPKLFEFKITLLLNKATIFSVFTLTTIAFIYTEFFLGIVALSLVFVLNYLSKNIFVKKIDYYQKESYHSKITILNWIEQYFSSYREISKNWQGIANTSWKNEVYKKYFISKKNQIAFYLYRDLLAQILVELPFLLNTSIVILGVYYEYLSLTQLFVWVGFSQFMINASNAYLENKITKKQVDTLSEHTVSILQNFNSQPSKDLIKNKSSDFLFSEVVMQDDEINKLSLEPGLYHIRGGNGSGKSTLMNIVLGYERRDYDFNSTNLVYLINNIDSNKIRVIDREAVIFDCFTDFHSQILGPVAIHTRWQEIILHSLNQLLPTNLVKEWMKVFIALEIEYIGRKDKILSSGERVILSLIRFFCSWDKKVNLLIIDECDSFLDHEKKVLFINTVNELAKHMAVYISCHDKVLSTKLENCLIFLQYDTASVE